MYVLRTHARRAHDISFLSHLDKKNQTTHINHALVKL